MKNLYFCMNSCESREILLNRNMERYLNELHKTGSK